MSQFGPLDFNPPAEYRPARAQEEEALAEELQIEMCLDVMKAHKPLLDKVTKVMFHTLIGRDRKFKIEGATELVVGPDGEVE